MGSPGKPHESKKAACKSGVVLDKLAAIQMIDVDFPTTDGRTLVLPRYTQPQTDQKILLERLGLDLPPQPPPRITDGGKLTD